MNIRICNAQLRHTGYKEGICRFFRIANAYTLRCRIANSAGRRLEPAPSVGEGDAGWSLRRARGVRYSGLPRRYAPRNDGRGTARRKDGRAGGLLRPAEFAIRQS
jgi:hypothetical protein